MIDIFLATGAEKSLALRALNIIRISISFQNIQIKADIMKEFGWPRLINCLQNNQSCPEMENLAVIIAKNFMFDNVAQGIQEIDQF